MAGRPRGPSVDAPTIASAMSAVSAAVEDTAMEATMMNVVMVKSAKPKPRPLTGTA